MMERICPVSSKKIHRGTHVGKMEGKRPSKGIFVYKLEKKK